MIDTDNDTDSLQNRRVSTLQISHTKLALKRIHPSNDSNQVVQQVLTLKLIPTERF